ncbi:MAG: sigma 54-interacting transcriptional regulator [Methylococcaceae bacterium]|nr:sigma 54-interacting transcriptional regulator [Methylococcaceae bacterium]
MKTSSFTLESLLETHDLPFVIINADLKIIAVNRACEAQLGIARDQVIGKPCCESGDECRHQRLFQKLEPYSGVFSNSSLASNQTLFRSHGYPLLDSDGTLYIGESLAYATPPLTQSQGPKMLGESAVFLKLKTKLQQAAETLAPVFLTGETGTGKELAAEFVHRQSKLAAGEFVIVDCTILGENLFESELFGHEKGSFTGAATSKKGLFELAHNGTLFLDEIGELPLSQQPKLLRALESGQFRRVGGTTTLSSKVRVVSATHRNIAEMVREGSFREDLFYRLSVFPVELPPLRDRRQDLPVLVDFLLQQLSQRDGRSYSINKEALMKLIGHLWPGNIRELRNCLQLATGLCDNNQIKEKDIMIMRRSNRTAEQRPPESHEIAWSSVPTAPMPTTSTNPMDPLEQIEANFLNSLINKYNGNRKLIASEMNVSERTLYRKLNRFNLN